MQYSEARPVLRVVVGGLPLQKCSLQAARHRLSHAARDTLKASRPRHCGDRTLAEPVSAPIYV